MFIYLFLAISAHTGVKTLPKGDFCHFSRLTTTCSSTYFNKDVFLTSLINYWPKHLPPRMILASHQRHISDKAGLVLCHRPGVIILHRAADFVGCKTRLKLSSVTLVQSQQHVLSCHGLVQLAWRTANAHIQLKQSLIHLSQNQCRSVPLRERQRRLDGVNKVTSLLPLPSFSPLGSLNVTQQPHGIEVLSGSSKWIVITTAVDHRQVFCFCILYCFSRDGHIL